MNNEKQRNDCSNFEFPYIKKINNPLFFIKHSNLLGSIVYILENLVRKKTEPFNTIHIRHVVITMTGRLSSNVSITCIYTG